MKKFFLLAIVLCCGLFSFSQTDLLVYNNEKGLFLNHTVSPKENFYSIGRLYNISPKDIAAFNSVDMQAGLSIGQVIKIPLNNTNFSQTANKGTPVYYVVGEKEGLYRVSVNNNKVLMESLRKWNNLSSDNINPGQKLIVGFIVSPELQSVASNNPPVVQQEKAVEQKQPEVKKQDPVVEKKPDVAVEKKSDPVQKPMTTAAQTAVSDANGGYFKAQFVQQSKVAAANKEQTVTAGIFKTASGWQDSKYYALMDNVEPGTIIRIENPTTNKAVYAKVLGQMSGIRQNQGLELRISNAAASVLEIEDNEKFIVKVVH